MRANFTVEQFQLHHTGIKTSDIFLAKEIIADYFNCTIQELKQKSMSVLDYLPLNFNCTIQELKHPKRRSR